MASFTTFIFVVDFVHVRVVREKLLLCVLQSQGRFFSFRIVGC
jgi:hypothetical protein